MKVQCQRLDRISTLPQETIEKILTLMPIRHALRTSILSKKWRYRWTRKPRVAFDYGLLKLSDDLGENRKYKLVTAIFHVMMLHRGPILELHFGIDGEMVNEIDQIILYLSWSKTIKKFCIKCAPDGYKLPLSFFSLEKLEHLDLTNCEFELPLIFNGFSMLKNLFFDDVTITANMLQRLLTSCPLLERFSLIDAFNKSLIGGDELTFVELFKCFPLVQAVSISWNYFKLFAKGGMPHKLPTSLVHLRILSLAVCFLKRDELSSVLDLCDQQLPKFGEY